MNRLRTLGSALIALLLLCSSQVSQTRQTQLRVSAIGPDGQPARLSRADLYLDYWGGGELVPLPRDEGGTTVPIDSDSICRAWPEKCQNLYEPLVLILQAQGYTPVTAQLRYRPRPGPFLADLEFASGSPVISIVEGESKQVQVSFRKPASLTLTVVDESGAAVSGVDLQGHLLFATSNHCGSIEGEELFRGKTDANGKTQIPDIGGKITVEFSLVHAILKDQQDEPFRAFWIPGRVPSTVTIHRLEKRALQLEFTNGGKPMPGLKLESDDAFIPCFSSHRVLGQTDDRGQVRIDDFYPEEYNALTLLDSAGRGIWYGVAPFNAPNRTATVRLPEDAIAIFAIIDRVVFEPSKAAPERVQIWGVFAIAAGDGYTAPERGFLYFDPASPSAAEAVRKEWADLNASAGTGRVVGFGLKMSGINAPRNPRIRREAELPGYPSGYPSGIGVVNVDALRNPPDIVTRLRSAARTQQ